MPVYLQDIEDRRSSTGLIPLDVTKIPASLNVNRWNYQSQKYLAYWNAFTGRIWEETIPGGTDEEGKPVLRYPLQINYIKTTCMKHSYILFGEVSDNPEPLVPARVTPVRKRNKKVTDDRKNKAFELEDFINDVWNDNNGRGLQQENGLLQQFLGGCIFKLSWHPEDPELTYGIKIETVLPDFFLPIWETGNPDNLLEAFIIYRMPAREAQLIFNHDGDKTGMNPIYIEHWTRDTLTITLDGKPISYTVGGETFTYDNLQHGFGFIPIVYIPRERAGSYYGLSLVDDLLGMAKELNSKLTYMGDIVQNTSRPMKWIKNLNRTPKPIPVGKFYELIDIGAKTPGSEDPEVGQIEPPSLNDSLVKYADLVKAQYARDAYIPGVADGEDEGSQRSALTLAFRMWPVTSKIRTVRTYWTIGLIRLNTMIAKIAIMKGVGGITADHLKDVRMACRWNPMIPRDNEQQLNEITITRQSQMLSPVTGIGKLNLVDDPDEEYEKVMEHEQRMAAIAASMKPAGGASGGEKPPQIQTKTQPVATIMKEPGES